MFDRFAATDEAIAEERRLCYVSMTRAQNRLTMTRALTRHKWAKARPTTPSRFLFEMTGQTERAPVRGRGRQAKKVAR